VAPNRLINRGLEIPMLTSAERCARLRELARAFVYSVLPFLLCSAAPPAAAHGGLAERRTPVVQAIQKVQPSVVSISSEKKAASSSRWPFTPEESLRPRVSGMGTGVIIDSRGFILTNQHVVDKVQGVEVHLADGGVYPARVVQQDPAMDIAILKIDAGRPLTPIQIGASSDLMKGETVITVGNAFGYENTTSVGVISSLGRNVTLSDDQVYRNLIQTDACINPGNSGGPLVNIDGELIGINVAVRAGAQGIGFALPIDDVKRVATDMMSTRRLAATWHGLVAGEARRGESRCVVLSDIQAGSPAESAGFQKGDEIVRVGDLAVSTTIDIERGLLDVRPGQKAEVLVRRAGRERLVTLEPQPLNRSAMAGATADSVGEEVWKRFGLRTIPVSRDYVKAVSQTFRGGLFVQSVSPGSAAARGLIQKGDILVGLNDGTHDWETIRPDNILFILNQPDVAQGQSLQYYVVRRNQFVQGLLNLGEAVAAGLPR
jgi:serine protease Do